MRAKPIALVLLLALALPPTARAAAVVAPPGNSEADQYFETVPGAGGDRSADPARTPRDAVGDGVLTPEGLRALRARGEAGRAAARLAAETAAPRRPGSGLANRTPAAGPGDVGSAEGLGDAFPPILVGIAGAALAYAVRRRAAGVSP